MFETLDESALLDVMLRAQRRERIDLAERLLAAGRLCLLRLPDQSGPGERSRWCVDDWEAVAIEVGGELGISRGRAGTVIQHGVELIERFPKLAKVFAAGDVDYRVITAILFRAGLIVDPEFLAVIDEQLAGLAGRWNALSREKICQLVDWRINEIDPAAIRAARPKKDGRFIDVGPGPAGLAEVWGRVHAEEGAAFDERLDRLADSVCPNDPRTKDQRRVDAFSALMAGTPVLACACGGADCTQESAGRAETQVVVHVLAEAEALTGKSDTPALVPGFGSIPAERVRDIAATTRVRPVAKPGDLKAESRYRPSRELAEYVRLRDMTCRFPGCDRPAEVCDLDHTVPWPLGPTHPSNLKATCRTHHLLKTFYVGPQGWSDQQLADGTVIWTSPAGRTYVTKPAGPLFFPQLAIPTGELILPDASANPTPGRGLAMPTRRQTRVDERASCIQWERGLNEKRWAADPPPF
jgi:hypothetical protein